MHNENTELRIFIIRHAEAEANLTPGIIAGRNESTPLTVRGERQAARAGRRLSAEGVRFDNLFCSTIERAVRTCGIIAGETGYDKSAIVRTPALDEMDQGEWEGKAADEIYTPETMMRIFSKPGLCVPPGGESHRMVQRRSVNWLEDEIIFNPRFTGRSANVGIVSHAVLIKTLLHYVMGFNSIMTYRISMGNTSINELLYRRDGWFVERINDTAHLAEDFIL